MLRLSELLSCSRSYVEIFLQDEHTTIRDVQLLQILFINVRKGKNLDDEEVVCTKRDAAYLGLIKLRMHHLDHVS